MDQSKKDTTQNVNPEPKNLEDIQAYQRKWDELMKDTDRQIKQIREEERRRAALQQAQQQQQQKGEYDDDGSLPLRATVHNATVLLSGALLAALAALVIWQVSQLHVRAPVLPRPLDTALRRVTAILAWCSRQWFIGSLITSLVMQMVILPCFEQWMGGRSSQDAPGSCAPSLTWNNNEGPAKWTIAVDDPEALFLTLAAMLGPDGVTMSKLESAMAEHTKTATTTTG
ncbi:hypothetical protein N7510_011669 [Penicillium lagena]|uniref:uncharacterized protein n=1 Tax=Penicillium lagena TaxID=94218 RepID=UPI0025411F97|nr:uncharacterized protein N7510_011669 [Penicillium lagena]KAJ5602135.1 hypothetical protein N7510_011669 [Penicillium lagena]